MTEHDLRNLLIEYEATTIASQANPPPGGPGRFFVRFLMVVTFLLWLAAVAVIAWYLIYTMATIEELVVEKRPPRHDYFDLAVVLAVAVVSSIVAAGVSTLVLVFTARAARLRRINSSLFELFGKLLEQKRNEVKRE